MNEREEIVKAQQGDDEAFSVIMHAYMPRIYTFIKRLANDETTADDALQETFIKAWKNLKKFDIAKPLAPWLFTIARNAVMDTLRKRQPILFSSLTKPDDPPLEETIPDTLPLPDELFERKALGEELWVTLLKLPLRDRTVLLLRYEEDLTFEEIATIMAIPANTVRSIHRRALFRLRDLLIRHDAPK